MQPQVPSTSAASPLLAPYKTPLVFCLLIVATILLYWPARYHDFVNYDDPDYVYENPIVLHGLTKDGFHWTFANLTGEHTYWHPLTWLSHMTDCQIFGHNAGAHHLVNVAFHALNAGLLFLLLNNMTGAFWRSTIVSALFAWHPLQVDTVAWIAERKNVLSTLFWLLTMLAYVRYTRCPSIARYALVFLCFALGLMAKPMLVTLPIILLLLDIWPLNRLSWQRQQLSVRLLWSRPMLEKIPLLTLSLASALITIIGHHQLKSLATSDKLSLGARVANALVSCVRYVTKTLWPSHLAVYYPHPGHWPLWLVLLSALLLLTITLLLLRLAIHQSIPALVGWLWFLITLLPVIGIIQASSQAMADRFIYIPVIGLFISLVWLVADLLNPLLLKLPSFHFSLFTFHLPFLALSACLVLTRLQLRHWQDSESLFTHALHVTPNNPLSQYNLGCALMEKNKPQEAIPHFQAVLKFDPNSSEAHVNLGVALRTLGKQVPAAQHLATAVRLKPDNAAAHNNLGLLLAEQSKTNEAIAQLTDALRLNPNYPEAHYNLANLLAQLGDNASAADHYLAATRNRPGYAEAHYQLAVILSAKKDVDGAILHYREAVRLKPTWVEALNNLAWLLATIPDPALRNGPEALVLASRAVSLTQTNNPGALDTLAAALAANARFTAAAATAQHAAELAQKMGMDSLTNDLNAHLALYRSGQPLRE